MAKSYPLGSAPWEQQRYDVGSAPWETPQTQTPVAQPSTNLAASIWDSMASTATGGLSQANEGLKSVTTATNPTPQEVSDLKSASQAGFFPAAAQTIATGLRKGVEAVKGLGNTVGGLFSAAAAPVLGPASMLGNAIGDKIGSSFPDKPAMALNSVASNPVIAKSANDILALSNLAFPEIADLATQAARSAIDSVKPEVFSDPNKVVADAFREIATKYSKSAQLLTDAENVHGTDPIGVIGSYGNSIVPKLETGKITPNAAADMTATLEQGIRFLSNIKNEGVFLNDTKLSFQEYQKHVIDTVEAQAARSNWPKAYTDKILKQVDALLTERASTYQNGLDLAEIDKLKTQDTKLSRSYRSTDNFQYDAYGILGKANRSLVEMFSDGPTAELNKLIQSHYDAIDIIESLVGRAPHGGRLTALAEKWGGGVAGAVIGGQLGNSFLGYIGGRVAGNVVDSLVTSNFISNPLKRLIAKGAEIQDPAIAAKMQEYIKANMPDITELGDNSYQSVPNNQLISSKPSIPSTIAPNTDIPSILPQKSDAAPRSTIPTAPVASKKQVELPKQTATGAKPSPTTASKPSKAANTSTGNAPTERGGVSAQKADTSGGFDGTTFYRGEGGNDVAQGKALLAKGRHFAMDSEYPKRFGEVKEHSLKPGVKVFDASGMDYADIREALGLERGGNFAYLSQDKLTELLKEHGYDVLKYDGTYKSTGKPFTHVVEITPNSFVEKPSPSIPKYLAPLAAEARKYKSAEEFVKAQKTTYFHGTKSANIPKIEKSGFKQGNTSSELGKGTYITTSKDSADMFGEGYDSISVYAPNINSYELSSFKKSPKSESSDIASRIIARDALPPTLKNMTHDELAERIRDTWFTTVDTPQFWLEKAGYEGATDLNSQIAGQMVVWNTSKLKTKSQLTDLWRKANGK